MQQFYNKAVAFAPFVAPPALSITTSSPLPAATQSSPYTDTMAATGGVPPYTWSLVSQTGSNGWVVSSAGVVSGTPSVVETDSLVIKVTDSVLSSTQGTFSLTVNAAATGQFLAINSSGLIVNSAGTPIMLRGGNIAGLQDQTIVNTNTVADNYTGVWGNQASIGGAPVFPFFQQQKLNSIRLNINAQSFQNIQSRTLIWGGSLGASSWGSTNIPGDNSAGQQYKATILQSIRQARAYGMYTIVELHECAPQFTVGGTTQYLSAINQPPFIDAQQGLTFWTSNNPAIGMPAWLATQFGSASFNTANGFNGGAAGTFWNAAYGGSTGLNDIIFELFNEPYLSNQAFTLTTVAGTFGNVAWRAHNGGSNYTTTNGGTPPTTPGSGWTAGAEFVMLFGGTCNWYFQQGSHFTGPADMGIPPQFTSPGGMANALNLSWTVGGYQTALTGIRSMGFTNICAVNGSGFASALQSLPYYLPVDTLSPPQIAVGNHAYPNSSAVPAPPGTLPASLDSQSVWTSWGQIVAGTLTGLAGQKMPVLVTETGDYSGASLTTTYMGAITSQVDSNTTGGVHIWPWITNDAAAFGTAGNAIHQSNICGASFTFTGTISGSTLTVTAISGTPITIGTVLIGGMSTQLNATTFISAFGTGTGGLGTYTVVNSTGASISQGSTSFTACVILPWNGQGSVYYNWTSTHP
jgi:Cellulase (glycosyl hydrolase family 5)